MGRTARGVRGVSLRGDDYVTGVAVVEEGLSDSEKYIAYTRALNDLAVIEN